MKQSIILVVIALLSTSACSTIIEGRTQSITINTTPDKASCELTRKEEKLGKVDPTPGVIIVKKTKEDILIECSKKGYETTKFINKSGSAAATVGNVLAGGLVGWGVDSATGADNKYDSPVNITLVKK